MSEERETHRRESSFRIASDEMITIGGMRGTGKTTLARYIARQFHSVYVFDPLGQYSEFSHYVPEAGTVQEFDYVCQHIWERGNVLFVIEECEGYLGERMSLSPYAFKIVLQGRNRGIGMMAITRRIANLSKTVFSLSDHVYLFRFFSPNDIHYCQDFIGREWASKLATMPKHHFLYYSGEGQLTACPPINV